MKKSGIGIITISLAFVMVTLTGCLSSRSSEAVRKTQKAEIRTQKKAQKKYRLMVKQHYKNQDAETRKRMKATQKMNRKSERARKGKTNIFDRIF